MKTLSSTVAALAFLILCLPAIAQTPTTRPTGNAPAGRPNRLRQAIDNRRNTTDLPELQRMTWTIDGVEREALVYLPPKEKQTQNPPMVLAFHGHGGRGQFAARKLDIHTEWPEAVVVYPTGLPTAVPKIDPDGKYNGWQKAIGDENDRDLKFFDAILATMKKDQHIDEKKIYITGHSNGAYFTYILWAARGDQIAAVAPVAGALSVKDFKLQKPKPLFQLAGTNDPLVKFEWQERTIDAMKKLNGVDEKGKDLGDGVTEYTSKTGPPVQTYIYPGGHEIPTNGPKLIAEFFKAH